jgi:hypothetical protein
MSVAAAVDWPAVILTGRDPSAAWGALFNHLRDLARSNPGNKALHGELVVPDRLLAECAWDLWSEFHAHAPLVSTELKHFWAAAASSGTAVLLLDGLSLRELPLLVQGAQKRGTRPVRVEVRGTEVPTETDRFAAALGLTARAQLAHNRPPAGFIFAGPDVFTDVLDAPFADCLGSVPARPRLFLWHTWPDEDLVHRYQGNPDGPQIVADEVRRQLLSDPFWDFVDRLRQGRRLVITGDHGYAVRKWFSSELTEEDTVKLLRQTFGAGRCACENPDIPWPRRHLPPLVVRHDGWLVVLGQRKWKVQGGSPFLCHGGLSLLEAAVPSMELPPL